MTELTIVVTKQIYSFVADDGTNTHIDVMALRKWCLNTDLEANTTRVPIDAKVARNLVKNKVVSPRRVHELANRYIGEIESQGDDWQGVEPIIFCKDCEGPIGDGQSFDGMLVDGHHRYVVHALFRSPYILAYVLSPSQWEPFRLHLPDLTKEELAARPITKRNY